MARAGRSDDGVVTGRGIIQSADRGLAAKPAGAAMSPKPSRMRKTRSIVPLQALPMFVPQLQGAAIRSPDRVAVTPSSSPGFFAQVLFVKIPPGKHYIGGKICQASHMFVHGLIRAGRTKKVGELSDAGALG